MFGGTRHIAWETRKSSPMLPLHLFRVADIVSASERCEEVHETNERDSHDERHERRFPLMTMESFPLQEMGKTKLYSRWLRKGGQFHIPRRTPQSPGSGTQTISFMAPTSMSCNALSSSSSEESLFCLVSNGASVSTSFQLDESSGEGIVMWLHHCLTLTLALTLATLLLLTASDGRPIQIP